MQGWPTRWKRQRLKRRGQARLGLYSGQGAAPPEDAGKPAAASKAKKPEKPEHFTAVAPGKPGDATKKKAKKAD